MVDEQVERQVTKKGVTPIHIVLTAVMAGVLTIMVVFSAITTTVVPGVAALYPATALEVVFGIWFGAWGVLAAYLGLVIGGIYAGWYPIPLALALGFADAGAAFIPALAFRLFKANAALKSTKDWVVYIVFGVVLSSVIPSLYGNSVSYAVGWIPSWEAFWVATVSWNIGNYIVVAVIGTPLLRLVTEYVKRSGLFVQRWLT